MMKKMIALLLCLSLLLGFASVSSAAQEMHKPLTKRVTNFRGQEFDLTLTITDYSSRYTGFDFTVNSAYAVEITLYRSGSGTTSPEATPLGNLTPDCVEGLTYTRTTDDYTFTFTASGSGAHDLSGTPDCTTAVTCSKCRYEGDPDLTKHAYGAWESNGDGTHTRKCANNAGHIETKDCTGGTAKCKTLAICKDCTAAYGTFDANNHQALTLLPYEAPTETKDGKTAGEWCSACGITTQSQQTIPAHAHKGICAAETTCTVANCGATIPKDADNHTSLVPVKGTPATETTTGLTDGEKCTACGTTTIEQQVIPMRPKHTCEPATVPTCTQGSPCKVATCENTFEADPDNHTALVVLPAEEPTTTETGLTEGQKCEACGTTTIEQQIIPMLPTDDIPETGDDLTIFLFAGLALASALGMVSMKKREQN